MNGSTPPRAKSVEPHFHVISQRANAFAGFIARVQAKGIRVRSRPATKYLRTIYTFHREGSMLTLGIDPLRATRLSLCGADAGARLLADDLVALGILIPD